MENTINKAGFGIGYTNTTIRFNMYSLSMFVRFFLSDNVLFLLV